MGNIYKTVRKCKTRSCCSINTSEALAECKPRASRRWTFAEDTLLILLYKTDNKKGKELVRAMRESFPENNYTIDSVINRIHRLTY